MPCLAQSVAYHRTAGGAAISSLILATEFRTFTALAAALAVAPAGAIASLFNSALTDLIGVWQFDGTSIFLISPLELTLADGSEFAPGTDFVLFGSLGAVWQTPGASGGLKLSVNGLVTWPCCGLHAGRPGQSCHIEFDWTLGTPTSGLRCGAGWASALGNEHAAGGVLFSSASAWFKTIMWGMLSAFTATHLNQTSTSLKTLTPPGRGAAKLDSVAIAAGNSSGSYNAVWVDDGGPAVASTRCYQNPTASFVSHDRSDLVPCAYFNNDGDAGSTVIMRRIEIVGARP